MQKFFSTCLVTILLGVATGASLDGVYHADRFRVYFNNDLGLIEVLETRDGATTGFASFDQMLREVGATDVKQWLPKATDFDRDGDIFLSRFYEVTLPDIRTNIQEVVSEFTSNEHILFAERVPIYRLDYEPNDPRYNQQWYIPQVTVDFAWDMWDIAGGNEPGDENIVVGIVDTGCDWDHPDLIENLWQNMDEDYDGDGATIEYVGGSWQLDSGDLNGVDDDGDGYVDNLIGWDIAMEDNNPVGPPSGPDRMHGTHVAGVPGAATNNNLGMASEGWKVKHMPIKCAQEDADGIYGGYNGILCAAQTGADIINCSWGGGGFSGGAQAVINVAYNNYGTIIIASAGNGDDFGNEEYAAHYPSGYDHVISVTALGTNDAWNHWATYHESVDFAAPGENILSTVYANVSGGYESWMGTSMASPVVAGCYALLWSYFPDADRDWIEQRLLETADPVIYDVNTEDYLQGRLGVGRPDVFAAIASGVFPSLSYQSYSLQLTEDDGDGVLNPGESSKMRVILANEEGWATATNVAAVLSSTSPYIDITDDSATFPDITGGGTGVNITDRFEFSILEDAPPADISLTLTITAGVPPADYQTVETFDLELTLNQSGFPFTTGGSIYSSPLILDIDQDGSDEIVFGSDDYSVYALGSDGSEEWSFATGSQVRGSAAAADLEGDGDIEIVFCSKDQKCYILNSDGSLQAEYSANGFLMTAPVLRDLDGDGDLEIIFGGFAKYLYVIHHDGTDFGSFPLYVDESIMVAPAVGDIDNDGSEEIVVGTWSNNVWAFELDGTVVSGFPFSTGNKINSDPALADLDGDGTLEILVGSDDNYFYSINSDGSERFSVYSSGDVRGSPTVEDVDGDGDLEIFYGSNIKKVFGLDHEGNELTGWPQSSTSSFKTAPVFADLNNSGQPSIIAATSSGTLYAWDSGGNIMDNFPISLQGTVLGSFAVSDIDGDGDLEIASGASSNLVVIDIKTDGGSGEYWSMYRLNPTRSGNRSDLEMGVEVNHPMLPSQFVVYQNYPNPFNPSTTIRYDLSEQSYVQISIHDLLGRNVRTLVKELQDAGQKSVVWDGKDENGVSMSAGIYFCQVHIPDGSLRTKKMVLLK